MQCKSARLKIARARRHIQELEAAIQSFVDTDFCRLISEKDEKTGDQTVKLSSIAPLPSEISLITGDAVHNLRSALDHVMVQILGDDGKQIAFPMAKDRNNPGSHQTHRIIKDRFPDLAQLLTETICIHDTGDICLWAISELDNVDKHNLLIAIASVHGLENVVLEDAQQNTMIAPYVEVDQGGTLNLIKSAAGGFEVKSRGRAMASVSFGTGLPLDGKPLVKSLVQLADLTGQTVDQLVVWFGQRESA